MHLSTLPLNPYTKDNPLPAKLLENRVLNKDGSGKDTRHLVVDIAGSGLTYAVGDSLGVYASNRPQIVDELIELLGPPATSRCCSRDCPLRSPSACARR